MNRISLPGTTSLKIRASVLTLNLSSPRLVPINAFEKAFYNLRIGAKLSELASPSHIIKILNIK